MARRQTSPSSFVPGLNRRPCNRAYCCQPQHQPRDQDNRDLSLTVNNLANDGRQARPSPHVTAYPYYNIFNFNGYGRAWWLEWRYDFGASSAE